MPGLSADLPLLPLWAGLSSAGAPALRLWLRWRLSHGKELAGRLDERRGIDATLRPAGRLLWLHAASVGETASVLPLLPLLLEGDSELTVLVTTGTVTAAQLLLQRVELGWRGRVVHRFVPLDVPAWIRRFLDHWRPDAAAFVESELWPNILAGCRRRGVPLMLLNARMSERSATRWQRAPAVAHTIMESFARVHARNEAEAQRFRALGARRVAVLGDLKLAAPPLPVDAAELERLRAAIGDRPVWLAASTHPGEEALLFAVHRQLSARYPDLLTIIAPRHPERGAAIAAEAGGLPLARRSLGEAPPARGIWLADTLGELGLLYRLAPITFVGRSLLPPGGGQNPLEPARLGCAVAVGPHTGNFKEHIDLLAAAEAVSVVPDPAGLAAFVDELLACPAKQEAMAKRAATAVQGGDDIFHATAAELLNLVRQSGAASTSP